jgi:hypothetical protein
VSQMDKDAEEKMKDEVYRQGDKCIRSLFRRCSSSGSFPELGLCNRCSCLRGVVTESGVRSASCGHSIISLTGKQKIRSCNYFWDKTHIGLQALLEFNPLMVDPKEPVGF